MNIPDDAIEAVAKTLAFGDHPDADEWWTTLPDADKYRTKAGAAIEAAVPFLAAKALEDTADVLREEWIRLGHHYGEPGHYSSGYEKFLIDRATVIRADAADGTP
jgi:hypothetical protein